MSVTPRTEGLGVRWTSGTVDGRGLVPTNLFGQDESCVLAQFRAFVRQVPESDVGKRCTSLGAGMETLVVSPTRGNSPTSGFQPHDATDATLPHLEGIHEMRPAS